METTTVITTIDARGMACPGPLMTLIGAIRAGTGRRRDRGPVERRGLEDRHPGLGRQGRHELVEVVHEDGYARFVIRKAR